MANIEQVTTGSLEKNIENSIFLKIIKFGLGHPKGFTWGQITEMLEMELWEKELVNKYLDNAYRNTHNIGIPGQSTNSETPFFATQINRLQSFTHEYNKYIVSFDAHFKYLDYQELKFARENAKDAKRLAMVAIGISIIASAASIVMPFFVAKAITQTVKVDDTQLVSIERLLNMMASSSK